MLKKALEQFFQNKFWLLLIFIFSLGIRLILLDKFPIGMTHDELNYVVAAKSFFKTGKFVSGTAPAVLPTQMQDFTVTVAEVPVFLLMLIVGPLPFSLFASRMVGALLSSLTVLVVYHLVMHLFADKKTAIITSFVMAINPWSFLMGRTVFEVNFFVFFFLLGFLVLLKKKDYGIFYALPFYLLGFFSYTGGQIAFYFFIIATLFYHYFSSGQRSIKPYLVFSLIVSVILASYAVIIIQNQSMRARGGELYLPTLSEISGEVNSERLRTVPWQFNNLFINKLTVYGKGFLEKYLNTFSADNLFLNGELRAAFSYQKHGTFYFVDLLFLLVGFSLLFFKSKKTWWFLLVAIAVGSLTSGLSTIEHSYSQRAGLMYPFLIILIGLGLGYVMRFGRLKYFLLAIYLLLFVNLLHIYFYRFPVYASDGWFFQDRVLVRYIDLTQKTYPNKEIIVSTFEPKILFHEYLFYLNAPEGLVNKNYSYRNVSFVSDCFENGLDENIVWIFDGKLNCREETEQGFARITRFRDVLAKYVIKKDFLCRDFELGQYVHPEAYRDFSVEGQSRKKFCQSWITKI